MAEMIVNSPELKKTVTEYDIHLDSGLFIPLTIDESSGDTIEFKDDQLKVSIKPKPSKSNPDIELPEENYIIFTKNIVGYQYRTRQVVVLTKEQQAEWDKTIQELGGVQ